MASPFLHENPLSGLLSQVADLMLLNLCFILCSLPVVTAGAAFTAAHSVAQGMQRHNSSGVVPAFFAAFVRHFFQSTLIWVPVLGVIALLGGYYLLFFDGSTWGQRLWFVAACSLLILLTAVLGYFFPLVARYENRLSDHLKNAVILAVCRFPRTVAVTFLTLLPFILLVWAAPLFFYLLPVWLLAGFAGIIRTEAWLLAPVLRELDWLAPKE